jgi:hypothetical protein
MSAIRIAGLQSLVAGLLAGYSPIAALGLSVGDGILIDDGQRGKPPERAAALTKFGLCITVLDPEHSRTNAELTTGVSTTTSSLGVIVEVKPAEEPPAVDYLELMEHVIDGLQGKPSGDDTYSSGFVWSGWANGFESGVKIARADFLRQTIFSPV